MLLLGCAIWYTTSKTGAATYTWDGGGTTNDWSECANWSSNTCPGSADIAQFNSTSVKDATIDASFAGSVAGVSILSGYTGTITQSRSLSVGVSHFSQAAGTYVQGDASISASNNFTLSGGVYSVNTGVITFINAGGNSVFTCTGIFAGSVVVAKVSSNLSLTQTAGCDLTAVTLTSGNLVVNDDLKVTNTALSNHNITVNNGGTLNAASTTSMNLTGSVTVNTGGVLSAPNLTTFSIDGSLTLQAGATFSDSLTSLTIDTNFTLDPAATFTTSGKTFTFGNAGGSSTFTCTGVFAGSVVVAKVSSSLFFTLASGCEITLIQNVTGRLTINGTLNAGGYSLGTSINVTNGALLRLEGSQTVSSPTFSAGSTVEYVGSGTYTSLRAGATYSNLVLSGTGTYATSSTITVARNFTQTAGTFNHTGTLNLTGTSAYTITTSAGSNLSNLTVNGSGGTYTLAGSGLNLSGNLTLTAGTLDVSTGGCSGAPCNIYVAGNWNNSATFIPRTGTVVFDGSGQTLSGNTTFYNLTKSVATSDTLTFTAGQTFTIDNQLTLNGAPGQLLLLRSTSNGSQWSINPKDVRSISYIDVKDSNNSNSVPIATGGYSIVDSGNNTNWYFTAGSVGVPKTSLFGGMRLIGGVRLR